MNVVCIGSGYVGCVTGATLAAVGHKTTIVDLDSTKVNIINNGKSPIYESGLEELIKKFVGKTLIATTSYEAISDADVIFIAVGTPAKEDSTADLKYILSAAKSIARILNPHKFTVIVNKSTVPVGTADFVSSVVEEISGLKKDIDFAVVSNPEFLREGSAVEDVFFTDRVVIGTSNEKARMIMRDLYQNLLDRESYFEIFGIISSEHPLKKKTYYMETDTKSAEMIKYASNSYLAVKISYINDIARLCEVLDANVLEVAKGMGLDPRIGDQFLQVSSGWSGSCLPKDTAEFLAMSQKYDCELSIIKSAIESNIKMHHYCVEKLQRKLKNLHRKNIGVLGLTFKPNTDDARQTQTSIIIKLLVESGATIKVYDPKGMDIFKKMNSDLNIIYCDRSEDVSLESDAILLLTHWGEFLNINWKLVANQMRRKYIFDARNFLDKGKMRELGFEYEGIGFNDSVNTMTEILK